MAGDGGGGEVPATATESQYAESKTSVWWDIENCHVPRSCDPYSIAQNVRSALAAAGYRGAVTISAYGDTNKINSVVQQALSSTGVSLNHVPPGIKDASDKKIMADMLFWGYDNLPPANVLLISGDRDFSNALHKLRMRRYNILLAQPVNVSQALVAAAKNVWLWTDLLIGGPPLDDPNLHNALSKSRSAIETPISSMTEPTESANSTQKNCMNGSLDSQERQRLNGCSDASSAKQNDLHNAMSNGRSTIGTSSTTEPTKSANSTKKNCINGRVDSQNTGQQNWRTRSQSSTNLPRTPDDGSQEGQQPNGDSDASSAKQNVSGSNVETPTMEPTKSASSTRKNFVNGRVDTGNIGRRNWRSQIQSCANLSKTTSDGSQEGQQHGGGSDASSAKQNDRMIRPTHSSNSTVPGFGLHESSNKDNISSTSPCPHASTSGFGSYENANVNNNSSTSRFPRASISGTASYENANWNNSSSTSPFPQTSISSSGAQESGNMNNDNNISSSSSSPRYSVPRAGAGESVCRNNVSSRYSFPRYSASGVGARGSGSRKDVGSSFSFPHPSPQTLHESGMSNSSNGPISSYVPPHVRRNNGINFPDKNSERNIPIDNNRKDVGSSFSFPHPSPQTLHESSMSNTSNGPISSYAPPHVRRNNGINFPDKNSERNMPNDNNRRNRPTMNNGRNFPNNRQTQTSRLPRQSNLVLPHPTHQPWNPPESNSKHNTRSLSSGTYSPSVSSTSTAWPNVVPSTSLPDISKLNVSENPSSLHQNPPLLYHSKMSESATVMDGNTSNNGSWGTPGRPEPSILVQGQIGFILRALHILKTEKIAPTEANVADCIGYGEINIQNFDVNSALRHAIEHQLVLLHKYGDNLFYVGKNDTLWNCVNIVDANVKHPKEKFDALLQFLSSSDGRAMILASQCRYQAALVLKRSCFKDVGLGEILQILHVIIQVRKWIVPHSSGWLPLCISVSANSNANVVATTSCSGWD